MSLYLDAVAALGNGSLHPGGFAHTLEVLNRVSITTEDVVLEIGCGTGRTACHLAKNFGAHVFAMDNSEKMLAKAKVRAEQAEADVRFVHGDAVDMPFKSEVFDLVFIESVLVFLQAETALKECSRVLKKRGLLVCVELVAAKSLPADAREDIQKICGLPQIPSFDEWLEHFDAAGLTRLIAEKRNFPGLLNSIKEVFYRDPYMVVSPEINTEKDLSRVLQRYKGLILRNRSHLGYGTFIYRKS